MDIAKDGWTLSAAAWIENLGDDGDFLRRYVMDPAIERQLAGRRFKAALDVGCGEGRFCRKLKQRFDIPSVTGIDPTAPLLDAARLRDPNGRYIEAAAENLPFPDERFDLVVSYLTLIDIEGIEAAISEIARVATPGGTILIVNLNGFTTANGGTGWVKAEDGSRLHYTVDNYLNEHADLQTWRGMRILNYHRPMSRYFSLLLGKGLQLKHFDEPSPIGGAEDMCDAYRRVPYAHLMEWQKPAQES
ncbi:class I SAM-dependent methyltransferase [Rhizobium panacihumi]|uniref:class I SAM-dependent methyltransferase n=1 Tax=Rhizobium panacihumi TaxID=2008450 RepID=UPI003D7BEC0F